MPHGRRTYLLVIVCLTNIKCNKSRNGCAHVSIFQGRKTSGCIVHFQLSMGFIDSPEKRMRRKKVPHPMVKTEWFNIMHHDKLNIGRTFTTRENANVFPDQILLKSMTCKQTELRTKPRLNSFLPEHCSLHLH